MSSYLDHLPSREREKIRKRLRSSAEYEKLREKVKGPEDLERELPRAEAMAELHFELSSPERASQLRERVQNDIREQGIDVVIDGDVSAEASKKLAQGKFTLTVDTHPEHDGDALVAIPEGTVKEKLAVKPAFSESYAAGLQGTGE